MFIPRFFSYVNIFSYLCIVKFKFGIMARLKGILENLSGSTGNVTFRHEKDGSVVMLQKITSRRPSRSKKAMMAQLPLGNVNAMERLLHDDVVDRFEGAINKVKARGMYISLNLQRRKVYLTKQMKDARSCVLVDHVVSYGQLTPIEHRLGADNTLMSDVRVANDILETTTVADFARDVLRNNAGFNAGDVLAFYFLKQHEEAGSGRLWASAKVCKVVLDPRNGDLLSDYVAPGFWAARGGCLAMAEPLNASAAVFVHFRTLRDGRMLVSTQTLLCVNPVADYYMTAEALDAAVESRGGYTDKAAFLMPSAEASASEFDVNPSRSHFVLVRSSDEALGKVSTGRGSYLHGTEAVLTAVPGEGAWFVKWTDEQGNTVSCQSVYRLRVLSDGFYTAHFEVL